MNARLVRLALATLALIALMLAPAASAAPRATQLERVSSVTQPGIVYLETTYQGYVRHPSGAWLNRGRPLTIQASCSGFFVNPDGHFVTAGHCVDKTEGRSMLIEQALTDLYDGMAPSLLDLQTALQTWKVYSVDTPAKSGADRKVTASYGVDYGGFRAGKPLPARVQGLRAFDKGDVALLKLEVDNVPVLKLAPAEHSEIGTKVVSVGYPGSVDDATDASSFDPSFKEGSVSSEKTVGEGLVKVTEISAALSGGMSGGPTVDLQGRVLGVNSFGPTGEPQPFNFITPVSEVAQLLADEGVENELGSLNSTYRQGLASFFAGDRDAALAKFDDVLGQVPEHEFAQQFRANALRLPVASQSGGIPVAISAGLAGLALILAIGAVVYRRRRARPGGSGTTPATPPQTPGPARSEGVSARTAKQESALANGAASSNGGSVAPMLIVESGPGAGERIAVDTNSILGRGDVAIKLEGAEISRRHAQIDPVAGSLMLTDLGSVNGTIVNGRRIDRPVVLVHGDSIELGDVVLRFELSPDAWRQQATVLRAQPVRTSTQARAVA